MCLPQVMPLAEVAQYFLELKFLSEILITIHFHWCLDIKNAIIPTLPNGPHQANLCLRAFRHDKF